MYLSYSIYPIFIGLLLFAVGKGTGYRSQFGYSPSILEMLGFLLPVGGIGVLRIMDLGVMFA